MLFGIAAAIISGQSTWHALLEGVIEGAQGRGDAMIGERLDLTGPARPAGRILATHLGTGLADVVFGIAIAEAAARLGLGTVLAR